MSACLRNFGKMKFLILLSVAALVSCGPVAQEESVMKLVIGNFVDCMSSDMSLCLKEHALKVTERLRSVRQLNIVEGVTILNNGPKEPKSLELSSEPELRKKQVSEKLWESTSDLLKNSELEFSWAGPVEDEEESRALDNAVEGRDKKKKEIKKKLKILVPLLILAKIKAAAIIVASIVVIAASLAKIAIIAKIAFIAKVIAIIKHLLQKKHHEEEHGWIPHHEHHEHHEPHSHGWDEGWNAGWSRSREEMANNLAYSSYSGK